MINNPSFKSSKHQVRHSISLIKYPLTMLEDLSPRVEIVTLLAARMVAPLFIHALLSHPVFALAKDGGFGAVLVFVVPG
jgi:hypothetical protein